VDVAVCHLPSRTEANVGKTDTGVDEENGKTGQGEEPIEDHASALCQIDERQATEQQLQDDHVDGATLLVDLSQEFGGHACDLWLASYDG
jgi:hypothetical protein